MMRLPILRRKRRMNEVNPLVEKQYTEWVYPEPIADLAAWAKQYSLICDPSRHHALIWPQRTTNPKLSILVAGCGTSQAAILAYTNPQAVVTGIDISPASIEHSLKLKAKHKLANLELQQMDLHKAADLKRKFDLIYCTGVLHHLPDPQTGLKVLANVVEDDGVLCLTLYAKYARAGIYMLQETFRHMGLGQTKDDIATVRRILESLPPSHPAQAYIRNARRDLSSVAGIVDTFLHPQDWAFTVPDILALLDACGLHFQSWTDKRDYDPAAFFAADDPVLKKIAALPEKEQWAIMERLTQHTGLHSFLARKVC